MPGQSADQKFQTSWQQTAAWAQGQGIKYNQYYPIYQQDSQRVLEHGVQGAMSQAEREYAIQAAANPQQAAQKTPSTSANPFNIIGNTITDLRNIFTGIGDIAIHPLHNGLVDGLYNTFDLMTGAHKLHGGLAQDLGQLLTGTVLSWVPGAADIGQVLEAPSLTQGIEGLAEHPISSLLDVSAIGGKLAALKVAGDAGFAERVGMVVKEGSGGVIRNPEAYMNGAEKAQRISLYRVGKGFLMNTKLRSGAVGPTGALLTVGDKIHDITGGSAINTAPPVHDLGAGVQTVDNRETVIGQYVFKDVFDADDHLDDAQKAKVDQIIADPDMQKALAETDDPAVAAAVRARLEGPMSFQREEILAQQGMRAVEHPKSGKIQVVTQVGHAAQIKASDDLTATTDAMARTMPELEGLVKESDTATKVLGILGDQLRTATSNARVAHDATQEGGTFPVQLHGAKNAIGYATRHVEEEWFGTGGKMDQLLAKLDAGHILDVSQVAHNWLRRMDKWSPISIDATSPEANPAFRAAKIQVQQIAQVADKLLELRKEQERRVYGGGKIWEGGTPFRDRMHENEARNLDLKHAEENRVASNQRTFQFNGLKSSYQILRRSIQTKYADLKRKADAEVQTITQKYEIEKAKATTQNLLARETFNEWRKGRVAQGLTNPREALQAAQEGVRIAPGAPGSPEALLAAHTALELQKQTELAQVTPKNLLTAQMKIEMKDSRAAEKDMTDKLTRAYDKRDAVTAARQEGERADLRTLNLGKRAREGEISQKFNDWMESRQNFTEAVWKHPSDNNTDLYFNILAKHIVKNEEAVRSISQKLAEQHGWGDENLQNLHANPVIMSQLIQAALMATERDPIFEGLDPHFLDDMGKEARDTLADLNKRGIFPEYISHVSGRQLAADGKGSMAIRTVVGKGVPHPDALSPRNWDMASSKFDVMAGLQKGVREILMQKGNESLVRNYLDPHISLQTDLESVARTAYKDELDTLTGEDVPSFYGRKIADWNLERVNPVTEFGMRLPKWGDGDVYMNKDLLRAYRKMTEARKNSSGVLEKGTKLFRYSILGLSPRYDAHITLGGTFLLALRSTPYMPSFLMTAVKGLKTGQFDMDAFPTMTQMGTTEYELGSANQALNHLHVAHGREQVRLAGQEHIVTKQGVKLAAAKPIHWVRALADLNLNLMNYVVKVQRTVAMLDGAAKAERDFARNPILDEWGKPIEMTRERALMEGQKHAMDVFGDLRRMSPFERQLARTVIPFYGWEKHILQYVFSFPADHPWRAMMLANMAEFDSESTPGGLPSRYQFLFFLGKPDDQGNVTALDLRAMNPLRDVANYATLGGVLSSLNPMITAGVSYIDPSIIYGGNTLYPNLTYDQFYGIETAGPQGNLLTAAAGVVPQLGAIQSAMQLAGQRQGMSSAALVKSIGNQLNFPWVPQHLNLRQEAAKTAIARYQVTKNLTSQAWDTGNFQPIADLGSVPDPRNPDYETPVSALQALYATLAKEYPGQNPADVAAPLPAAHL